jgi:D-alanine-D-alanine ligase
MAKNRILILYNEPVLPTDHPDSASEREVLGTVDFVRQSLAKAGFDVLDAGASHDINALIARLRELRPDAVFNAFEGTADDAGNEAAVAGLLEWLGIPYSGCPFQALCLARNKPLTKTMLHGAGLPTPRFWVVDRLPVSQCELSWPVIVKPALQDASVGLDHGSVVGDQARLEERVQFLLKQYGAPVLVEEYIDGRELNAALIEDEELRVLPISEVMFVATPPDVWPIVTYDAKWKPGSRDFEATPTRCPAEVSAQLDERLQTLARQAFCLLGCRDYARVDFRVRGSGEPYILEVNPNPSFHPAAGFAKALAAAGISHQDFTAKLIRLAQGREAR